jgi:hypothetical protein
MKWDEISMDEHAKCIADIREQHVTRYLNMFPPKEGVAPADLLMQFYHWAINTHLVEAGHNNPYRKAGYLPVSEAATVVNGMRQLGYVAVVFTPSEMEETHLQARDLEDRLCEFGNRVIENNPADDEEEEDGQEEGT